MPESDIVLSAWRHRSAQRGGGAAHAGMRARFLRGLPQPDAPVRARRPSDPSALAPDNPRTIPEASQHKLTAHESESTVVDRAKTRGDTVILTEHDSNESQSAVKIPKEWRPMPASDSAEWQHRPRATMRLDLPGPLSRNRLAFSFQAL